MGFEWASLIPSAIQAAGSFFGGERANSAQAEVSQAQMDFQERMSSSAHQREVADLRAAGLNPILSAKYGGSSTPPGSTYQVRDSIGEATRAGVSTALQSQLLESQIENMKAQTAKTIADEQLVRHQATNAGMETGFIDPMRAAQIEQIRNSSTLTLNQINFLRAQLKQLEDLNLITEQQLSSAQAMAAKGELDEQFWRSDIGKLLYLLGQGGRAINPFSDAIHSGRKALSVP